MSIISLDILKSHCRADDLEGADDAYLGILIDNAEATVATLTRRTAEELCEMGGGSLPKPLYQAVLMLAAYWYNQREAVGNANNVELPYSLSTLIKPFVKLTD